MYLLVIVVAVFYVCIEKKLIISYKFYAIYVIVS